MYCYFYMVEVLNWVVCGKNGRVWDVVVVHRLHNVVLWLEGRYMIWNER